MAQSDPARRYLAEQITAAEKHLKMLLSGYELIPKLAVRELLGAKSEIDRWTTRRRTLIEVWEYLSNDVWLTNGRKKQTV